MAPQVVVDYELCESNAMCMDVVPEVFDLDDDDVLQVLEESPDESLREQLVIAVDRCPKQALKLVDEAE